MLLLLICGGGQGASSGKTCWLAGAATGPLSQQAQSLPPYPPLVSFMQGDRSTKDVHTRYFFGIFCKFSDEFRTGLISSA